MPRFDNKEVFSGDSSPSLDDLIQQIDQRIDKVVHPYAADGFEAFLGSQLGVFKKRGQQYIIFKLCDIEFALPLKNATEIGHTPDITPLPNLPQWVVGICNIRGDIVSVVDLKQIFQLDPDTINTALNLIIIHDDELSTAVLVEKIIGVFFDGDYDQELENKSTMDKTYSHFIQSVFVSEQRRINLLNVKSLISALELDINRSKQE
jgi:chemotaxis signal transduction protein